MASNTSLCISFTFCLFLIIAIPLAVVITLSSVGVDPKFYIQRIYVPALNLSINSTSLNSSMFMEFQFKRVVAFLPIRYTLLNITVYDGPNRSFPFAYGAVPTFKQGQWKKTVHRKAVVEARGPPWDDARWMISGGPTAAFVVELTAEFRIRSCNQRTYCHYWKAKTAVVAVDFRVGGSREEVLKKAIRLRYPSVSMLYFKCCTHNNAI